MILGLIAVCGGGIYFFRALSGTFGHYRALSGTIGHLHLHCVTPTGLCDRQHTNRHTHTHTHTMRHNDSEVRKITYSAENHIFGTSYSGRPAFFKRPWPEILSICPNIGKQFLVVLSNCSRSRRTNNGFLRLGHFFENLYVGPKL
jgi:hypothetical protein